MCLAMFISRDSGLVDPYALRTAWRANPHGAGLAYPSCINGRSKLEVHKGIFDVEDLIECVQWVQGNNYPALVHFRWATHGAVNESNCHPFRVNKKIAVIHNGVIPGFGSAAVSDTWHYTQAVLKPAGDEVMKQGFQFGNIGTSKLVFLDASGRHRIVNGDLGHWVKGVWYSNYSYLPRLAASWNDYYADDEEDDIKLDELEDELEKIDLQSWEDYCKYRDTERELIRRFL